MSAITNQMLSTIFMKIKLLKQFVKDKTALDIDRDCEEIVSLINILVTHLQGGK